jgi:hypothetical protein
MRLQKRPTASVRSRSPRSARAERPCVPSDQRSVPCRGVDCRPRRHVGGKLRPLLRGQRLAESVDVPRREVAFRCFASAGPHTHPVGHDASQGYAERLEPVEELHGLLGGLPFGAGDQDEGGCGSQQEGTDVAGARSKALRHALERQQELGQVLDEADARQPLDHLEDPARAALEQSEPEATGRERGVDQHVDEPAVEELEQALGRLEEVEGVLCGRGVDDDQVEAATFGQLVDLLHRGVLHAPCQRVRDVLIDRVREDPLTRLVALCEAVHQIVEGALHVEHHGPQRPAFRDAKARERRFGDGLGLVAERSHTQRVRESTRRVDGEDQRPPALARRFERECCGDRRLAHSAAAHAHDDAPFVERVGAKLRCVHAASGTASTRPDASLATSSGPRMPSRR